MGQYIDPRTAWPEHDVRLETRLNPCENRVAVLSDGSRFPHPHRRVDGPASNPVRCSPPRICR